MINYHWSLDEIKKVEKNHLKVFSCFSCGGGSSMGYKLAGFEVIGNNEIDPRMNKVYRKNFNPKYSYEMPIQQFKMLDDLPDELYNLDILDGSPPCSVFSMSGDREKKWGGEYKFKEGQVVQELDNLFFDYLDVVEKLKPKVVVAENVRGIMQGTAKGFMTLILKRFQELGYNTQAFLLNAATMGVPQKRERVFFIASRKDFKVDKLKLNFNKTPIFYGEYKSGYGKEIKTDTVLYKYWSKRRPKDYKIGNISQRLEGKQTMFNTQIIKDNEIMPTILSKAEIVRYDEPYFISTADIINAQSFPYDYDFMDQNVAYICGMSVPPLMMKCIAEEIYKQWFKKAVK